jgi:hypothetical protein
MAPQYHYERSWSTHQMNLAVISGNIANDLDRQDPVVCRIALAVTKRYRVEPPPADAADRTNSLPKRRARGVRRDAGGSNEIEIPLLGTQTQSVRPLTSRNDLAAASPAQRIFLLRREKAEHHRTVGNVVGCLPAYDERSRLAVQGRCAMTRTCELRFARCRNC